jgi:uncharacterized protein (UPF0332 family)
MNSKRFLAELVQAGKLKEQNFDQSSYNNLLRGAKRNFDAALLLLNQADEVAFKCIYEGLLQIGRLILSLNDLRPDDGDQHKTTFQAAGAILGGDFDELITKIQKYRIKRNRSVYESDLLISRTEADAILETARQFWARAKLYLKTKNNQLELFADF